MLEKSAAGWSDSKRRFEFRPRDLNFHYGLNEKPLEGKKTAAISNQRDINKESVRNPMASEFYNPPQNDDISAKTSALAYSHSPSKIPRVENARDFVRKGSPPCYWLSVELQRQKKITQALYKTLHSKEDFFYQLIVGHCKFRFIWRVLCQNWIPKHVPNQVRKFSTKKLFFFSFGIQNS